MKLLIVEDEEKINRALKEGLKEEGFNVESAFDGNDAQDLIFKNEYDCIILDIMLPYIDGITILREMRHDKNFTPVIILTAKDEVEDKIEGLDRGADDYLAKPFSFEELLARIKAVIRRASANQSVLQVDNLILDPYKKLVSRNGKEIMLTSKDFSLLEYLMRNKGSVISEDRMIRHLWSFDEDVTSNVVASHIKNLRQKIDKSFPKEKPLIQTLRRLGYKING